MLEQYVKHELDEEMCRKLETDIEDESEDFTKKIQGAIRSAFTQAPSNVFGWFQQTPTMETSLSEIVKDDVYDESTGSYINTYMAASGTREQATETLESLQDNKKYVAYVTLDQLMKYEDFLAFADKYEDFNPGWVSVVYTELNGIIIQGFAIMGTKEELLRVNDMEEVQVEKELPEATVVWLMYDKDDFPEDDFDNTQYSAEGRQDKREYRVAWSNKCIELWFVWHYQELVSDNGREHCRKILEEKIGYEKKQQNIYDVLADKTEIAIQRAEKQYESYGEDVPPSKRCPATRVHELVKYLQQYL